MVAIGHSNMPIIMFEDKDGKKLFDFSDLTIDRTGELPSQTEFQLRLSLRLGYPEVREGAQDPSSKPAALILVSCRGTLTFHIQEINKNVEVKLQAQEDSWQAGGLVVFTTKITPMDFERLNEWRAGKSMRLAWRITGYAIVDKYLGATPLLFILAQEQEKGPVIDPTQFSRLGTKIGMSEKFIHEMSLEFPKLLDSAQFNELAPVRGYLKANLEVLREAVKELRNASTAFGFGSVVREVRDHCLDNLRTHLGQDADMLSSKFFVDAGSIIGAGADVTARKTIDALREYANSIHNLCSKVSHSTTQGQNPQDFLLTATRAEAEFALFSAIQLVQYLVGKLESCAVRGIN